LIFTLSFKEKSASDHLRLEPVWNGAALSIARQHNAIGQPEAQASRAQYERFSQRPALHLEETLEVRRLSIKQRRAILHSS
jgi:hypothetical protein